ncbi:MAG: ATP-grasp domain-containing protein [Armatimonadetes bacterium]|nr:ATP-grasp domain-containing protein [Armatimonadota bacterium]
MAGMRPENAPTLLLPPRINDDTRAIESAARDAGYTVVAAPGYRLPLGLVEKNVPVIVYGDPMFGDLAALSLDLALLEPPDYWLPRLEEKWRKRHVSLSTLAGARSVPETAFIKPAADKSFPARVYESAAQLAAVAGDVPDDLPVLVSKPVTWDAEYRVFALAGKVVAASPYYRRGKLVYIETSRKWDAPPGELAEATEFAAEVLAATGDTLPSGVVLDVGLIAGQGWAVVEANPAWASGLYGCAPPYALTVVAASVRARADLTPEETPFARAGIAVEW